MPLKYLEGKTETIPSDFDRSSGDWIREIFSPIYTNIIPEHQHKSGETPMK